MPWDIIDNSKFVKTFFSITSYGKFSYKFKQRFLIKA
jgi:hypothetical protein